MSAVNRANIEGLRVTLNEKRTGVVLTKTGGSLEITGRDEDEKARN